MIGKRVIGVVAGSVLILAVGSAFALAQEGGGFGGHGRGGHSMWLLAHAAGLTHSQIATAFQSSNVKADRANLKVAHDAMMTCLVAGNCTNQVASYASAVQTMAQDRMTVWQTLFKSASATNLQQAASVYSQLQALHAQQKQIFQGVFGSQDSEGSSPSGTSSSSE
jgi:hypothetical protein